VCIKAFVYKSDVFQEFEDILNHILQNLLVCYLNGRVYIYLLSRQGCPVRICSYQICSSYGELEQKSFEELKAERKCQDYGRDFNSLMWSV